MGRLTMSSHPNYFRVLATFLRNSLVRELTFRGNFLVTMVTRLFWFFAQVSLFEIIFRSMGPRGEINGWDRPEYFAFMATGMLINAIVETFFMPNCDNFSEMIRTGNLDFVLLKPIDTQFLISFEKANLAMLNQVIFATGLLTYALYTIGNPIYWTDIVIYLALVGLGVCFFYSLMLILASTSIFFGRNQGLYDFWFYVTIFARYPRSIYSGGSWTGNLVQTAFTYVIPVLLVVTVPARVLLGKIDAVRDAAYWQASFIGIAIFASIIGLAISRLVFFWSLKRYRSASS